MAYKNIVFVKLEKRLLNDYRWFTLSSFAQLLYIKLILLAAETYNKIPKNFAILQQTLRLTEDLKTIETAIIDIKKNYPKFKENKHFYYFEGFEHKTNYLPDKQSLSNCSAIAQQGADIDKEIDKDKEEEKETAYPDWLPLKEFLDYKNMRKQIKRPMSVAAERLAIGVLARLKEKGFDPKKVLEQSILNSWQGLFELKNKKGDSLADKYPAL